MPTKRQRALTGRPPRLAPSLRDLGLPQARRLDAHLPASPTHDPGGRAVSVAAIFPSWSLTVLTASAGTLAFLSQTVHPAPTTHQPNSHQSTRHQSLVNGKDYGQPY